MARNAASQVLGRRNSGAGRRTVLASIGAVLALFEAACGGGAVATPSDGIAYIGEHGDVDGIYVVTPDGQDRVRLTDEPAVIYTLAWSPDGTRIAFGADRPADGIYVMNADGTGKRRISHDEESTFADPVWSPDGTRIIYTEGLGGSDDLYVVNVDGSALTRLASPGERGTWSPDGSRIAFTTREDIYVVAASGGMRRRIAAGSEPAWAPDRSRIAFERCETDAAGKFDCDINVIDADGSGERTVVGDPALDEQPVWSPDGGRIVFERETGEGGEVVEVWVTTPDGARSARVARDSCRPAWSPEGRRLAFHHSCASGFGGIWVASADGTGAMRIAERASGPAWRPQLRP